MPMFDEKVKGQLSTLLNSLKEEVNILFFTQEIECHFCKETRMFVEEFSQLTDKLNLTTYNFQINSEEAKKYGVDKIPAIVILDKDMKDNGIKFYGIPGGYEINSFVVALQEVSGNSEALPENILSRIQGITKDIHIQVFVTLGCPYCPAAVAASHRLALENKNIKADMIESSIFNTLAIKHSVKGVPKIIINETLELEGAQPIEAFLDEIEKI